MKRSTFMNSQLWGSLYGRYNLACLDGQAGNDQQAFKHYILAARAGHPGSLDRVKKGFRNGQITKDEFKKALKIHQKSVDEI